MTKIDSSTKKFSIWIMILFALCQFLTAWFVTNASVHVLNEDDEVCDKTLQHKQDKACAITL